MAGNPLATRSAGYPNRKCACLTFSGISTAKSVNLGITGHKTSLYNYAGTAGTAVVLWVKVGATTVATKGTTDTAQDQIAIAPGQSVEITALTQPGTYQVTAIPASTAATNQQLYVIVEG